MIKTWERFIKSAEAPAIVDSEALKGNCSLVRSKDGMLQLIGRKKPDTKNSLVMSEKEAIDLYLKLVSKFRSRGIKKTAGVAPMGQAANVSQGSNPTAARPYTRSDLLARTSATTARPTVNRGTRVDPGVVKLLKYIEPFVRTNGNGRVNRDILRAGMMDYFSKANANATASVKAKALMPMTQQTNRRQK